MQKKYRGLNVDGDVFFGDSVEHREGSFDNMETLLDGQVLLSNSLGVLSYTDKGAFYTKTTVDYILVTTDGVSPIYNNNNENIPMLSPGNHCGVFVFVPKLGYVIETNGYFVPLNSVKEIKESNF